MIVPLLNEWRDGSGTYACPACQDGLWSAEATHGEPTRLVVGMPCCPWCGVNLEWPETAGAKPIGRCPAKDDDHRCSLAAGHGGAHDCGWTFGEQTYLNEVERFGYYRGFVVRDYQTGFYAEREQNYLGPFVVMSMLKHAVDHLLGERL